MSAGGLDGIVHAWDTAARHPHARAFIHPAGLDGDAAYRSSGLDLAEALELSGLLPDDGTTLDFGCGDGRVLIPLHDGGRRMIGADASPAMLARVHRQRPELELVESDGLDLLERLGRPVEAIVALAVLIHHDHLDGARIIDGLARALAPGGILILDLPVAGVAVERPHWLGVTTWTLDQVAALAGHVGLELGFRPPPPLPLVLMRRRG